ADRAELGADDRAPQRRGERVRRRAARAFADERSARELGPRGDEEHGALAGSGETEREHAADRLVDAHDARRAAHSGSSGASCPAATAWSAAASLNERGDSMATKASSAPDSARTSTTSTIIPLEMRLRAPIVRRRA